MEVAIGFQRDSEKTRLERVVVDILYSKEILSAFSCRVSIIGEFTGRFGVGSTTTAEERTRDTEKSPVIRFKIIHRLRVILV